MIDFYWTHLTDSWKIPAKIFTDEKDTRIFMSEHKIHKKYSQKLNGNTANFNQ